VRSEPVQVVSVLRSEPVQFAVEKRDVGWIV
jgi:hypothetical protein